MRKRGHGGGEATARAIGQAAAQAGIALSLHAPYFVNPANPEPDSQAKTAEYVLAACRVARWMGADRVVVHTGAIQKRTRQAALATARECFRTLRHRCDEEGYQDILLCPETMGKINQLGDLEEVLTLCTEAEGLLPLRGLWPPVCPAPWGVGRPEAVERMLDQMVGNWGWPGQPVSQPFSKIAYTPPSEGARHNC